MDVQAGYFAHITFKLYDDVFDTLDWTKEPEESYVLY